MRKFLTNFSDVLFHAVLISFDVRRESLDVSWYDLDVVHDHGLV